MARPCDVNHMAVANFLWVRAQEKIRRVFLVLEGKEVRNVEIFKVLSGPESEYLFLFLYGKVTKCFVAEITWLSHAV